MATYTYTPSGEVKLGFSGTAESLGNISRLFDYNVDSINSFTATDFTLGGDGLSVVTSIEDYGQVTDFNGPVEDLGTVEQIATSTIVPFGSVLSVLQSQTETINVYAVDFVTGTRDTGVGVSTTLQLKDYCNALGSGTGITGKYATEDDKAFAYINDASGLDWINHVLTTSTDGDHHYVNFDSGIIAQWSSEYVYKGQVTSFDDLTEIYSWGIFVGLGGETGAVFKLPDFVLNSTNGNLGDINLSRASLKVPQTALSGQDGTLYFVPSLAGTGLFDVVTGYSPQESYPWLPEPGVGRTYNFSKGNYSGSGTILKFGEKIESATYSYNESSIKIFSEASLGTILDVPVYDPEFGDWGSISAGAEGQLDFEQLVGFGFTESVYPLTGTGSTNPLSYGVALTFAGNAATREIQVYGINPGDHLYPQPLDISSGIVTISGTPLVHPFVDYTPHYGIEKNIGIGTYAFRLSDVADTDRIRDYVASGTIPLLSGAAESITKVYDEYDVVIVDEISYEGILDTPAYNGYDDWGSITVIHDPTEVWGPIIGFGSFIPSLPSVTTYPFGLFNIVNGFSPQESYPWLPEPGVGRSWSFSKGLYTGVGNVSISGLGTDQAIYETLKIYGVDFVTGWVDSGELSTNWTDQWKNFCNGTGFGGAANGGYIVIDDYVVTYVANVAGQNLLNQFIANAVVGKRDYVNFDFGPAAKWSSGYKLASTTLITDLSELTDEYSYAPFQIGAQAGIAFKLPDFVEETFGLLGNINELYASKRISGELVHPLIDLTPHYGIEKNIGIGTTGIQITGTSSGIEKFTANPPENTQLFQFVGIVTAEKRVVFNPPEDTQLFQTFGYITEKVGFNYVGVGTVALTGTAIEKVRFDTPENTQLFDVSGIGSTKEIQVYGINPGDHLYPQPADFSGGLITISGELNHPDIDYTPHYGIEKNIGIGTTGILFRIGVGTSPDSEGIPRDAETYSNRYPINDKVPGTGIGTILFDQIRDTAKYGVLTPYAGLGTFYASTGYSPQEVYPYAPLGIGKSWSFTRSTYIASGSLFTPSAAITQEVNVYGYYGDDRDPGTSGLFTISSGSIEKEVESYVAGGEISIGRLGRVTIDSLSQTFDQLWPTFDTEGVDYIYSSAYYTETDAYAGTGSLLSLTGASEAYSAQTPEDTQLFVISGIGFESYSAQTPETEVLYGFNGTIEIRSSKSEVGIGQLDTSGNAYVISIVNYVGRGNARFVTHTCDNEYDTCDQEIFTSDYIESAHISFTANPPENTQLFDISGSGETSKTELSTFVAIPSDIIISVFASDVHRTFGYHGSGSVSTISSGSDSETEIYIGSGTIFAVSGSSESFSAQTPETEVLYTLSGSASTKIEQTYENVGIGLFSVSGNASTREIATYSQEGLAIISLSGELVYPDVRFIPSPDGSGTTFINGTATESLVKNYVQTLGSLFTISGGTESISYATYVGIGNITIQEIESITELNKYQIPRTYVVII